MTKKKTCTSKRCVSKPDSARYAKAKKERLRLRARVRTLATTSFSDFGTADLWLWTAADMIDMTPPPESNVCSGRWAEAMIAFARFHDCIAGQIEV